ncbi:glycosyl hydrolase catalytic core-domain-containing protein [Verticillium dahliae]|nr:glycosyl hydrolase catalytic core-domain-containing protein [Verticillium dahliae]
MFNKQAVTALASLALAKEAVAFNAHRHSHEERDIPAPSPDYAAPQNPLTTTPTYVVVQTPAAVEPPAPVVPPTTLQTAVVATPVTSPKEEGAQDTPKKETSSGSTGTSGGKRGFAYNDASLVKNFFTNGNECTNCPWAYNWDSSDNGLSQPGVEYVPQLWGPIDVHLQRWEQNVASSIKAGSTHILSFNECDMPSQCNLDASNIPGQGLDWLKAWVDACDAKGCVYDFCVVHWYSPLEAADTLFTHIKQASEICGGKPVWLTEFAPLSHDDSAVSSWIQTNIPKLDALKELERYSFFMVAEGNGKLISSGGLSGAGKAYASA